MNITETNSLIYNSLNDDDKEVILMYITARQFKNAIDISEMIIIPAKLNNIPENSILILENTIAITARGNKMINKTFPFIVNNAFACEVFLKIIIKCMGLSIPTGKSGHEIYRLYQLVKEKSDLYEYILKNYENNEIIIENEIKRISNAFVKWRYIYEKANKENIVNYVFLDKLTNILDRYIIQLINKRTGYNVEQDAR